MKTKFKQRIGAIMLCSAMLLGTTPVYAGNTNENGTLQSQVIAQIASSWVVTVPDEIELNGRSGSYSVSISGDVADNTSISIIPDSSFNLTDGVKTVNASVTQQKQQWIGTEIGAETESTTGTISVNDTLTAGNWSGSLNFLVNCTEDLGDLLEKVEMMNNLDVYTMGDSLIDGYKDSISYFGTAEAIDSLYGTRSYKNFAISGATLLSKYSHLSPVYTQSHSVADRLYNIADAKDHSVIVFDGGANDFIYMKEGKLDDSGSPFTVTSYNIDAALNHILNVCGSENHSVEIQNSNIPIIYILPGCSDERPLTEDEAYMIGILKTAVEKAQTTHPNLIMIDCAEFLEVSDIAQDGLHLNTSGQVKLAHKIVDATYDYLNN